MKSRERERKAEKYFATVFLNDCILYEWRVPGNKETVFRSEDTNVHLNSSLHVTASVLHTSNTPFTLASSPLANTLTKRKWNRLPR